jgi:colanic acid/amylovoran biosynthesis protein
MNYKICLMGAKLDSGNMGVSALTASLVKIILTNRQHADISLLIGNRSSKEQELQIFSREKVPLKVINFRLSPKAKFHEHLLWIFLLACFQKIIPFNSIKKKIIYSNPFLKTTYTADFIGDIRGGDSFSDIYGLSRLVTGSIPAIIVLLLDKKLILLPQTYGPYNSIIARHIAKFILKRAHYILSRDKEGITVIQNLFKNDCLKNIHFCPDVAFMLNPIKPEQIDIHPPISHIKDVPLIGFNINGLMYIGGYTRNNMFNLKMDYKNFACKLALTILNKTNSHILFIPHTFNTPLTNDTDACIDVMQSLPDAYKDRIHIIMQEYDQSEIKAIIGLCDFFVGSRMHACIAALSQGIPTVGVAYSRKFYGVFESIGVEDMVVDGRVVDAAMAVEKVIQFYHRRAEMKANLQEKVDFAKSQVQKIFEKILLETS